VAPTCSNCGAGDFVWANELKTGNLSGGTLSLRSRGEIPLGTRICRTCGHADLFLRDLTILHQPHTWRPGEFVPITPKPSAPKPAPTHAHAHPPAAPPPPPPAAPPPTPTLNPLEAPPSAPLAAAPAVAGTMGSSNDRPSSPPPRAESPSPPPAPESRTEDPAPSLTPALPESSAPDRPPDEPPVVAAEPAPAKSKSPRRKGTKSKATGADP
jgi:hypothetical protein